jgi:hypothetical protein
MNPSSRFVRAAAVAALALAAGVLAPAGIAGAKDIDLTCKGNAQSCSVAVKLAGGASNAHLRVVLPALNMRLVSRTVSPHWVQGAYSITGIEYIQDGFLFSATLNAVRSIPKGAKVTLSFEAPARSLSCKSVTRNVGYLSISQLGTLPQLAAAQATPLSCQRANAVANTWYLRFKDGLDDRSFRVNGVRYGCKLVPRIPQNFRCDGGGVRVRFAGPTGL